jgi:alpha-tubulin suppressor-like RCC1 family protein
VCVHPPASAGTSCRPEEGGCDVEEACDGASTVCPADAFEPDSVVCRPAEGVCDVEETCSGGSAFCPSNGYAPSGTDCDDGEYCTSGDECDGFGLCSGLEADSLTGVTSLCTGAYHACVVLETGDMKCWGLNNHGQIGDGTTINKIRPAGVSGLPAAATAVDCGAYHTCALLASSEMACWGWNVSGQVGDGTTADRNLPVLISAVTDPVRQMSAGGYHTCALLQSGDILCWGQNSYGQLGNGTTSDSLTPVQVENMNDATLIAVGGYHTCAAEGNDVYCWGHNAYGQIGDGTLLNRSIPGAVSGLSAGSLHGLSAGHSHSCAVTGGGRLECWGFNEDGQIGDGTTTDQPSPVLVSGMASGVSWAAAGYYHTCAVTASGAKCWGRNNHGQLGDGTTYGSISPVSVLGLGGTPASVGAGYYHTCALLASGQIRCWGQNNQGQVGDGSMIDSHNPVSVVCR